jgi:hypothetical protein
MEGFAQMFDQATTAVVTIAGSIAVFFVVVGAIMIMSAGSSPRQAEQGKSAITYAIIGLVIAVGAKLLVNTLKGYMPQ